MAFYPNENSDDILEDLASRKEFVMYNISDNVESNIIPRFLLKDANSKDVYLELKSYQYFVKNFINPNTKFSRLYLKWQAGSGKTIGALSIAMNFIYYYQKQIEYQLESDNDIGSVYIIGFTQNIFIDELLSHPEFGFISREEMAKLDKFRKRIYSGDRSEIEYFKKFYLSIKKRLYSRKGNGFFKFIGYKELANHLFLAAENVVLNKKSSTDTVAEISENDNIDELIKTGKIKINKELLDSFANSLIICDEIHNVYNSQEKNNWGNAIQYIINYHKSCRALYLSATPINNSPTEVIDLLNLLLPRQYYAQLRKSDFFDASSKLLRNMEPILFKYMKGRVSFIRNNNIRLIPSSIFVGDSVSGIDYLKFVRCRMSEFQYETYKKIDADRGVMHDTSYISDFVLPDPDNNDPYNGTGICTSMEIKQKYATASKSWKIKHDINYNIKEETVSGDFLKLENDLPDISSKYATMMKNVLDGIKKGKGKVLIYHNSIIASGVLFIREVLTANNIISEFDVSNDNTICAICGEPKKNHKKDQLIGIANISGGKRRARLRSRSKSRSKSRSRSNKRSSSRRSRSRSSKRLRSRSRSSKRALSKRVKSAPKPPKKVAAVNPADDQLPQPPAKKIYKKKNKKAEKIQLKERMKLIKNSTNAHVISILDHDFLAYNYLVEIYNFAKRFGDKKKFIKDIMPAKSGIIIEVLSKDKKTMKLFRGSQKHSFMIGKYTYFYPDTVKKSLLKKILAEPTKKKGGDNSAQTHIYRPARFVIVHSNLDRKQIMRSIEKYNHVNNIEGHNFMILIGSRLIKESINMNSVRNLMIMSRPDNIPILIQIIGRAIRLGSHKYLPLSQQHVDIYIYVSRLISDKLSYEENKYKEKIDTYKVIQNIEKLMHESAIDAYFNYDLIWRDSEKNLQLDILPYDRPNFKKFKPTELNLSTFNVFYARSAVEYVIYIIKRLFVEYSPCWNYKDLFYAIKNPPFAVYISTEMIDHDIFNIALDNLVFNNYTEYIEPKINKINEKIVETNLFDKIRNPYDKIIYICNGIEYAIVQMDIFYIMVPLDSQEVYTVPEMIYRPANKTFEIEADISQYLKHDMETNYATKKIKFINKWGRAQINNLELAICDYGLNFHKNLIEEIIVYIFRVWTDQKLKKSEYHDFYVKMLYYYDLQKLIAWAHGVNKDIQRKYSKYLLPVDSKLYDKILKQELKDLKIGEVDEESSGLINMLISSIVRTSDYWISSGMVEEYNEKIKITSAMFDGIYKKPNSKNKINADLMPVGHFLIKIPRFYLPEEGWRDYNQYSVNEKNMKENPIIIGYDHRSKTGLTIKFKMRSPNIKLHKDTRLIEKGSVCSTKNKPFLLDVAKKLDIDTTNTRSNIELLCQQIRKKLLYNELKARINGDKIRWFYFVYEST